MEPYELETLSSTIPPETRIIKNLTLERPVPARTSTKVEGESRSREDSKVEPKIDAFKAVAHSPPPRLHAVADPIVTPPARDIFFGRLNYDLTRRRP